MLTLEDVKGAIGAAVIRNGTFATLGFLNHRWSNRLSFAESAEAVSQLNSRDDVTCVLTTPALAPLVRDAVGVGMVEDPRTAFGDLHEHLARETTFYGRPTALSDVAPSARVHARAFVSEHGVRIGAGVVVEPNATILAGVEIGPGSVIRAGTTLGSEGFQVSLTGGRVRRLTHAGTVRIGANVEVQSGTCVDRALFGGATTIGDDTTIDKVVYIAHHVVIGARCRIGAGACITGSVTVGDGAWIGPNATIRDGLTIGTDAQVSLGSVVTKDVAAGQRVTGYFAVPHDEFLRTRVDRA